MNPATGSGLSDQPAGCVFLIGQPAQLFLIRAAGNENDESGGRIRSFCSCGRGHTEMASPRLEEQQLSV